ncbi:MAG TPA: helix-turn-helix transcriptional regulator [Gallicola sp.]|nr:helix-turn-helix transcriptional regulator [Gallicola sp.]
MLGENIRKIRLSKKFSMTKVSNLSGIPTSYISNIENGKRTNPSQETLEKLAEVLDTTISCLYSKNTEYKQEVKTINNDLAEIMDYLKKDSIYYNGMKLEEQEISFLNASINATIEQIKLMRKNK